MWKKSIGIGTVVPTQTGIKPGAGVGPLALSSPRSQPKRDGGIFLRKSCEKAQIHQPGGVGVLRGKLGEGFIQCEQLFVTSVQGDFDPVEIDTAALTASLSALFVARAIDENPPHGFGRRREKVASAVPALRFLDTDKSKICLVDQGGGL
jgi:hypothetical protein